MKEIITIKIKCKTISKARKEVVKIQEYANNENFDCIVGKKIEQVPETWEELKELCRKLKIGDCEVYITLQLTDKMKLYFYDNGEIIGAYLDFEYEFSLAKGRTPQQMWQIIKSLIGEE